MDSISEAGADKNELDRRALEAFVMDNPDLERLKTLMGRFNIFEAIGVVRQELRHSDFLAFLLDPQANHGLGDTFAKRMLQGVLATAGDASVPVTPINLDVWDLDQMAVLRKWQHVDILLLDDTHQLAVIVENKIGTGEHSDQLQRYHRIVSEHYPGWRIIGIYLTPSGANSSHEAYLPVRYGLVCDVIDSLAQGRASVVSPDLKVLMTHYAEMLRRHIVGDSEIARLCRQIYQNHKRALDLIYDHRPDAVAEVKEAVTSLVEDDPRFRLEGGGKYKTRFAVLEWDKPALLTGEGWTRSKRIMMFEFWHYPDDLWLLLLVGPGSEESRQKLFDMVRSNTLVFKVPPNLGGRWSEVFNRTFLEEEMYEDATDSERKREIRKKWDEFLREDLPRINAALKAETRIWEPVENEGCA